MPQASCVAPSVKNGCRLPNIPRTAGSSRVGERSVASQLGLGCHFRWRPTNSWGPSMMRRTGSSMPSQIGRQDGEISERSSETWTPRGSRPPGLSLSSGISEADMSAHTRSGRHAKAAFGQVAAVGRAGGTEELGCEATAACGSQHPCAFSTSQLPAPPPPEHVTAAWHSAPEAKCGRHQRITRDKASRLQAAALLAGLSSPRPWTVVGGAFGCCVHDSRFLADGGNELARSEADAMCADLLRCVAADVGCPERFQSEHGSRSQHEAFCAYVRLRPLLAQQRREVEESRLLEAEPAALFSRGFDYERNGDFFRAETCYRVAAQRSFVPAGFARGTSAL
jgi:hypothetical protein